ncbi:MAG: hypothetical protein U1F60_06675 [Planctomycetota bacterium]
MQTDPDSQLMRAADQLGQLPPKKKIVAGVVMALGGAATCIFLWDRGIVWGLVVLVAVFGAGLVATGLREQARARAIAAEMSRARAEWGELRLAIAEARRIGKGPVRYLIDRGYREFEVRRWIVRELDPGERAS